MFKVFLDACGLGGLDKIGSNFVLACTSGIPNEKRVDGPDLANPGTKINIGSVPLWIETQEDINVIEETLRDSLENGTLTIENLEFFLDHQNSQDRQDNREVLYGLVEEHKDNSDKDVSHLIEFEEQHKRLEKVIETVEMLRDELKNDNTAEQIAEFV